MLKNLLNRLRPSKGRATTEHKSVEYPDVELPERTDVDVQDEMQLEPMTPAAVVPERRDTPTNKRQARRSRAESTKEYAVLAHADLIEETAHKKVLLVGHSVWASLDPASPVPGNMVLQAERGTRSAVQAMLGRKVRGLRVALDARLFDRSRTRYALAIDAYLAWGLASATETTILLGGVESEGSTYLDVLVFKKRTLVAISDRELPSLAEPRFGYSLRVLLDELRTQFPGANIVAASPLPDWKHDAVRYLGSKPLRSLRFAPISAKSSSSVSFKAGALLAGGGMAIYCTCLAVGWHQYTSAVKSYHLEAADPILQAAGGVNNAKLELQQQQRAFMEAERPQTILADRSRRVVHGVATVPGLRIVTITFGVGAAGTAEGQFGPAVTPEAPGTQPLAADFAPASPADVHMVVEVPIGQQPAMEQAKALMAQISATTGLSLRLTPGGWNDDVGLGIRKLTIEGSLH